MLKAKDTTRIRTLLVRWYRRNQRPFPWRVPEPDPYMVLVSETMLQQTQAGRVAELLPPFLDLFPDVQALSEASNAQVIRAWKGLGYNSRAIRLRDAAQQIRDHHAGCVPQLEEQLLQLPGIGSYAAASIATFAFNTRTVVLDVNVRRVYSRLHSAQPLTNSVLDDATLRTFAEAVIPRRTSSEWHHAVMDLGATICMARRVYCEKCPLRSVCPSAANIQIAERSTPKKAEPMFRGEPRRIWRGRVVDALREQPDGLTQTAVVRLVFGSVSRKEQDFVYDLLQRLTRDRMVERSGERFSLPE